MLRIELLGNFRLTLDGASMTGVNTARLQSLLACLALHRDAPIARQQLAFSFWPDTTDARSRNNLRTLLTRLREALPEADRFLAADAQTIQWRGDAPCTFDVAEFEAALARRDVRAAIDLYRGDPLPTCCDDWIASDRERLRAQYIEALTQAVRDAAAQRNFVAAIQYGQRALEAELDSPGRSGHDAHG